MDKVGGEASERQRSKLECDRQRKEPDEKLYSLTRDIYSFAYLRRDILILLLFYLLFKKIETSNV